MTRFVLTKDYNQSFTTTYGEIQFRLKFMSFRGMWYCSILRTDGDDEEVVSANVRCCDGEWLIPWKKAAKLGNFRIEGDGYNYPHPSLEKNVELIYYTPDEISEIV